MTVRELLDQVQILIGRPIGEFYHMASRISQFNDTQVRMVRDSRALTDTEVIEIVPRQDRYPLPEDFLGLTTRQQTLQYGGAPTALIHTDVEDIGRFGLEGKAAGYPGHFWISGDHLTIYPTPTNVGSLTLSYVTKPVELVNEEDIPFNGSDRLEEFAMGLAYRSANLLMLPVDQNAAYVYHRLYQETKARMIEAARFTFPGGTFIRPGGYR